MGALCCEVLAWKLSEDIINTWLPIVHCYVINLQHRPGTEKQIIILDTSNIVSGAEAWAKYYWGWIITAWELSNLSLDHG